MKEKKSVLKFFAVLLVIAGVVLAGCSKDEQSSASGSGDADSGKAEKEVFDLSFSMATPDMHPITAEILKPWAERVEAATDGQVKIRLYPGGTLVKADSMLDGIASGLTDIGWVSNAYYPAEEPLLNALAVPGYDYTRAKIASYIDKGFIEAFPEAPLAELETMFVFSPAPGVLLTNKPVKSLEDLKGMQIRCDGIATTAVTLLGASPIAMPMAEAYEALSKNVIDGCLGPSEPLIGWNLAEVVKYMIETPFLYNAFPTVSMNKKVWESLPTDIQNTIRKVNEEFFDEVASGMFDILYIEGIKYGLENELTVLSLSDQEQARWKKAIASMKDDYAKKLNEMGLPGDEAMKKIAELSDKYNAELSDYDKEVQSQVEAVIK